MKFQTTLQGKNIGTAPSEILIQHAKFLADERVTVEHGDRTEYVTIVLKWRCSETRFFIEFSERALTLLQEQNDWRLDILSLLFENIG